MKKYLIMTLTLFVAATAFAMSETQFTAAYNKDLGVWISDSNVSIVPMAESVVDTIDGLDQSKAYTCTGKVRGNINGMVGHLKDCSQAGNDPSKTSFQNQLDRLQCDTDNVGVVTAARAKYALSVYSISSCK